MSKSEKAKHTAGPWGFSALLSGSENHRGFRLYSRAKNGYGIGTLFPIDSDGDEGEANSRLIASAPLLLEALRDVIGWIPMGGWHTEGPAESLKRARAAIAAATGEA